jgi:hypothetical protein
MMARYIVNDHDHDGLDHIYAWVTDKKHNTLELGCSLRESYSSIHWYRQVESPSAIHKYATVNPSDGLLIQQ